MKRRASAKALLRCAFIAVNFSLSCAHAGDNTLMRSVAFESISAERVRRAFTYDFFINCVHWFPECECKKKEKKEWTKLRKCPIPREIPYHPHRRHAKMSRCRRHRRGPSRSCALLRGKMRSRTTSPRHSYSARRSLRAGRRALLCLLLVLSCMRSPEERLAREFEWDLHE